MIPRGDKQIEWPVDTPIRDLHRQGLLSAAQGAEVWHGPVQPRQSEQTGHHACGLSQRELEQNLDRKTELDSGIRKDGWTAGPTFGRRQPGHVSVDPDQDRAALAPRSIVAGPVLSAVAGGWRLAHASSPTAWIRHVNRQKSEFCNNAHRTLSWNRSSLRFRAPSSDAVFGPNYRRTFFNRRGLSAGGR